MTGRRSAARSSGVLLALEQLYARLPDLECRGLCGAEACGEHIDASGAERARIAARGVDLDAPTSDGRCPALSRALGGAGRCTVHDVRPMVCRLWGMAAPLPCPHGCRPGTGLLSDADTMSMLLESLEVGGHPDAGIRSVLEHCLRDVRAAELMGRFLRGDRSGVGELGDRIRTVTS